MSEELKENPFTLEQRDFSSYNTLADANAAIRFKTEGLEIYIISEDKFYYWDGTWVQENITGGVGTGDMTKAVYDPSNKGVDVYSMDNMDETATKKIFTNTERTKLNSLGIEVEDIIPITSNGQTLFTLSFSIKPGTTPNLFINGGLQIYLTDYTIVGTTVTWLSLDFSLEIVDKLTINYIKN